MKKFFSALMFKVEDYKKNEKGITLLELLAAILILGIIAAITVPAFTNQGDAAREKAHVANVNSIEQAAARYHLEQGLLPTDFTAVVDIESGFVHELIEQGYLAEQPENPWKDTNDPDKGKDNMHYALTRDSNWNVYVYLVDYGTATTFTHTDIVGYLDESLDFQTGNTFFTPTEPASRTDRYHHN